MHPILKFPWEILFFLCGIGLILGIVTWNIDAILPSLVGGLILFLLFSMKRFSFIDITPRGVKIKLGCLATSEIRFSNIKDVSTINHKAICGIGVRACGRGETAIVTKTGDVVRLQLRGKGSLKLFGIFKISFTSLRLSPESQTEFIEILQSRTP